MGNKVRGEEANEMSFWTKMLSRVLVMAVIASLMPSVSLSRYGQATTIEVSRTMAAVSDYVPRERVLWNAENLRSYYWNYNGIQIQGLPYSWGGWDSPTKFTENYWGSYSSALGTDCAGFVSRAWELGARYGTWWLGDSSISQPITDKATLKPGDIYDDRIGPAEQQHVTLHYAYVAGYPWVYEATESRQMPYGTPWTGGVRLYYDYDGSRSVSNPEYTGHRYNYITDEGYVYLPYVKVDSQVDTIVHVANLDPQNWQEFNVEFYNTSGALLGDSGTWWIPANGRLQLNASSYMWGSQAWAVVKTVYRGTPAYKGPVTAAAELKNRPGQIATTEQYPGITNGSDRFVLSQVEKDFYGWNSEFQLLNIGKFPVNVTLDYYNRYGAYTGTHTFRIEPNSVKRVDLRVEPPPGMGAGWAGSATATATNANSGEGYVGNIVVTVNNRQDSTGASALYNATNSNQARATTYATQFHREYYNWNSGITIVNMGNRTETFALEFHDRWTGNTYVRYETIDPKRPRLLFATGIGEIPSGFTGSVRVYSYQYYQPLAMNVNHSNTANGANRQVTYEGGTIGALKLVAPIAENDSSYVDGLVVMNVGNSNTDVEVDYYNDSGQWQSWGMYYGLAPFQTVNIYPTGPWGFKGTARVYSLGSQQRLLANLNITAQGIPVGQDPDAGYLIGIPGIDELNPTAYEP